MMTQIKSIWENRDFLVVWGGQSISMFGTRVSYIAWIWWVLEKTNSPAAIAVIGIAAALPTLLLGPIAGAYVDRTDRRKVMIAMNLVNAVILGTAAFLMFNGALQVWHAYVLTVLSATATSFHRPALQSSIPNLVEKGQLTRANSLYQISRGISGMIGLLLGGILVGFLGPAPTFVLDSATFVLAGLSLLAVAFTSPRTGEVAGWKEILQDTLHGFRFLYGKKGLLYLVLLFALINFLLAPMGVLFPLMSRDVFETGAEGFGSLNAAISAGLLAGGFLAASLKRIRRHGIAILTGILAVGLLMIGFGLAGKLYFALVILALMGLAVAVANVFESVVFQSQVPNELQGRVFAANFALGDGLAPLSLALIGSLLTVVSTPSVIIASGVAILLAATGGLASRAVRSL